MEDRALVFEFDMPIRWGDMDAMGHVNNTVYFRYMEQCRISWFDALGLSPDPAGTGPVIVNASCDFLRQLEYPGVVRCRQYVGEIGRSSFQTYVDMVRIDEPGIVSASGAARVVWVDFPRRKSVPLPPEVRDAITRPWTGLI
jgi:acyl-CoA thioester hydrolase